MTLFLERFLNWVAIETLLSGILFFTYYLFIRQFRNSLDRFSFLSISFAAILLLPWTPIPVISEPILKLLFLEAATLFQGQITLGYENWFLGNLALEVF